MMIRLELFGLGQLPVTLEHTFARSQILKMFQKLLFFLVTVVTINTHTQLLKCFSD